MNLSPALPRPNLLFAALALLFVCRAALALVVIPPWQQPDEPLHLVFAETARSEQFGRNPADPFRQYDVLVSMTKHQWWRRYGVLVPNPLPRTFESVPFDSGGDTIGITPKGTESYAWYYHAIGTLFEAAGRLGAPLSADAELYTMRIVSLASAVLTLLVILKASAQLFGPWAGAGISAVMALHPQFVVVATTASPDAVANLAGAVLWWQGGIAVMRGRLAALPLTVIAAFFAMATDRMGAPLLLAAAFVCVWVALQQPAAQRILGRRMWLIGAMAVIVAVAAAWLLRASIGSLVAATTLSPRAYSPAFLLEFTQLFFKSWWFTLGWLQYRPPAWWMVMPYAILIVSVAGIAWRLMLKDGAERRVILLALMLIGIQVAAVYWTFFRLGVAAQGRYLFPFIGPALALMWVGTQAIVPARMRPHAAVALVCAVAALDASAWLTIGVPIYLR